MRLIDVDALARKVHTGMNIIEVMQAIIDAPVIERKTGRWVDDGGLYRCSNCNHLFSELWWVSNCPTDRMHKIMRFCPNCGADMREDT